MNRKTLISFIAMLVITMVIAGCKTTTKAPPAPPISATLTASPDSIQAGQSSTLTWSTQSATSATVDQGVGTVDVNGSKTVSPTTTTTYTLTATDASGKTTSATATVSVTAAPTPTPAPTPIPTPMPQATPDISALFSQAAQDIYFDYDKADIRSSEQPKVATLAAFLNQYSSVSVQIEGNADERGSTEFNLALGDKRANAVKDALVAAGVSADRLKTISYGKEKPVCSDATEDCWQKNRHDHFSQQ